MAIRENETRVELLGYDPRYYEARDILLHAEESSPAWPGCCSPTACFVSPNMFNLQTNGQLIIWVIVGGLGTLAGRCDQLLSHADAALPNSARWGRQEARAGLDPNLIMGVVLMVFILALRRDCCRCCRRRSTACWRDAQVRRSCCHIRREKRCGGVKQTDPTRSSSRSKRADDAFRRSRRRRRRGLQAAPRRAALSHRAERCGKKHLLQDAFGSAQAECRGRAFEGREPCRSPAARIARPGMGIKTQVPSVFDGLSVAEGIRIGTDRVLPPGRCRSSEPTR